MFTLNAVRSLTLLALVSPYSFAEEVKLGNMAATNRQICGKTIELNLADLHGPLAGHTIIGLKNHQSGKMDLFISKTPSAEHRNYDRYDQVLFDHLSKSYINAPGNVAITWGGSHSNLQKEKNFSLALGANVYACQRLEELPDAMANSLYGEPDDS